MADTHINAFFADVDEAEKKVLEATATLEAAKARLDAKKKEVGYVDGTNNSTDESPGKASQTDEVTGKALPNLDASDSYKKLKKK